MRQVLEARILPGLDGGLVLFHHAGGRSWGGPSSFRRAAGQCAGRGLRRGGGEWRADDGDTSRCSSSRATSHRGHRQGRRREAGEDGQRPGTAGDPSKMGGWVQWYSSHRKKRSRHTSSAGAEGLRHETATVCRVRGLHALWQEGYKFIRATTFRTWTSFRDGTWQLKELPGPPKLARWKAGRPPSSCWTSFHWQTSSCTRG